MERPFRDTATLINSFLGSRKTSIIPQVASLNTSLVEIIALGSWEYRNHLKSSPTFHLSHFTDGYRGHTKGP